MSDIAEIALRRVDALLEEAHGWDKLITMTGVNSSVIWRARKNLGSGNLDGIRFAFLWSISRPFARLPLMLYDGDVVETFGHPAYLKHTYSRRWPTRLFKEMIRPRGVTLRFLDECTGLSYAAIQQYANGDYLPTLGAIDAGAAYVGLRVDPLPRIPDNNT